MCDSCLTTDAANRHDPTGTSNIRRQYEAAMRRRFMTIRRLIHEAVVTNDVLGLKSTSITSQLFQRSYAPARVTADQAPAAEAFAFMRSADKVAAFMAWLRQMQDEHVLEIIRGTPIASAASMSWQNVYIQTAYQKGISDAAAAMRQAGATVEQSWISAAFNRPIHADRVGLIYTRAYSDLVGITEVMDQQISRILAQGMSEGRGPMYIARQMNDRVDKIGITRSRVLARTETIRAHADASLNSYREAEAEGVVIRSEFLATSDSAVCPICADLDGKIFTLEQADGMIPVHPNCRCAMAPSVDFPPDTVLA